MKAFFADTYYYIALLSPSDTAHVRALEVTRSLNGTMVTTAWVLTELADGMAGAASRQAFVRFYDALRSDPQVSIVPPSQQLFEEALELYRSRQDKDWSLTDCTSFVVMKREGLTEALTGDPHFEQAGFRASMR